jgi:ribosomal protein S4E
MANKQTFFRVTNEQVYNKLLEIEKKMLANQSQITINTWLGSTALTLVVGTIIGSLM